MNKREITKKFNLTEEEQKVIPVVITLPANFAINQKLATRNAGLGVGFQVLKIINEIKEIALAYDMDEKVEEGNFLFF